jgi:hypothetical protein
MLIKQLLYDLSTNSGVPSTDKNFNMMTIFKFLYHSIDQDELIAKQTFLGHLGHELLLIKNVFLGGKISLVLASTVRHALQLANSGLLWKIIFFIWEILSLGREITGYGCNPKIKYYLERKVCRLQRKSPMA